MQDEKAPFISIITINLNQHETTCEMLRSLRNLTYSSFETIVYDVAAGTAHSNEIFYQQGLDNITVINATINLGFGGANNEAARAAKGSYLLFLNNDTTVAPDLLQNLLSPILADPRAGICCPKILNYYRPTEIEYAGFRSMNMFTGRTSAIGFGEIDEGQYNLRSPTSSAHGCAMLISRKLFFAVNGFYQPYFLYYEDWDLSERVKKAGYKILFEPKGIVYHKSSQTVGKHSGLQIYYHTRNRILFIRRNGTKAQRKLFTIFFVLFTVPKTLLWLVGRGQFAHIKRFFDAIKWNLTSRKDFGKEPKIDVDVQ